MRDRASVERAGPAMGLAWWHADMRTQASRIDGWRARCVLACRSRLGVATARSVALLAAAARAKPLAAAAIGCALAAPAQAQFDAAGQAVLMHQHQVHTGNVLSAEQGALNAGRGRAAPGAVAASSVC